MVPRPVLKSVLGHLLWPTVTRSLSRRTLGRDVGLIYTFHYIGEPVIPGVCQDLFLSREKFAGILDFICKKMTPLAPVDFLERLQAGTLPPRAVMLTFDDCTRDAYTQALPELAKRNLKACFFVCPGLIDQGRTIPCLELMDICAKAPEGTYSLRIPLCNEGRQQEAAVDITIGNPPSRALSYRQLWPHLYRCTSAAQGEFLAAVRRQIGIADPVPPSYPLANWDELTEMHRRGMWIANHTMLHSTCYADTCDDFARDVARAFQVLDSRFPAQRRLFCYPYGSTLDVSSRTSDVLASMGTDIGLVTQGGAARPTRDGLLKLHREDATYSVGAAKLAPLLAMVR